ncbi:MAG: ATP synthase subunit I [Phaeodactylibacter sp.]|nr:ATP synthase subunit I [Phaeodactylibacter sp.]
MNEWIGLLLPFAAGTGLGVIFFGGLLITVAKGMSARYPALWFLASMLVRTAIVLAGFYFVAAGQFARMIACLAGFIIARAVITGMAKPPGKQRAITEKQHP